MNRIEPIDRAKMLYTRAEDYIYTCSAHLAADDCEKNCAIMGIDMSLWSLSIIRSPMNSRVMNRRIDIEIQYLIEVKAELYKL
jgi:hypothetical protein